MRSWSSWRFIMTAFTVATIVYAFRTKQPEGRFLKVPYDFRMPTLRRLRERFWNPEDPRIFTPHFFGVGWSVNLYQVRALLQGDGADEAVERRLRTREG